MISAIAEGRPLPMPYGSGDIRPLNLEDFKYAHDQVMQQHGTCTLLQLKR